MSKYYNIGKARIKGTEMSAGWHISPEWTFKAVWDHLDARDETARTRLPLRARDYGSLQLRYDGKGTASVPSYGMISDAGF